MKGVPPPETSRAAEIANAAVLMASDHASAVTGAITNLTCRGIVD